MERDFLLLKREMEVHLERVIRLKNRRITFRKVENMKNLLNNRLNKRLVVNKISPTLIKIETRMTEVF
jgi:hypothetical protein